MKRGISMSLEDVKAHQARNGFLGASPVSQKQPEPVKIPKPRMNKTEAEYGLILEAQKRRGEVDAYFYEGITLKWGDTMRYTADFVVYRSPNPVTPSTPLLIEVKNAHIWDRDLVRFKGCRAEWKEYFDFEMWQKKAGSWTRIL